MLFSPGYASAALKGCSFLITWPVVLAAMIPFNHQLGKVTLKGYA
jgi:hypothetical protein